MNPATDLVSEFIGNFRQIDERLFAGAQPQLPEGIQELATKYSIKSVVDLQGHQITEEGQACAKAGIDFYSDPLPGVEIVTEPAAGRIDAILAVVNNIATGPVFVHCLHGADRTGAIVGIYRVEHGATVQEAIAEMRKYHNSWIEFGYRDAVEDFYERHLKGVK